MTYKGNKGETIFSTHRVRQRLMALARQPIFWFVTFWGHTCIVLGTVAFYALEHEVNPKLPTFLDALVWSVATVTTVGYGDAAPVTTGGKVIAIGMMVLGFVFIWTYVTLFVGAIVTPDLRAVEDEVTDLEKEFRKARKEIDLDEKSIHLLSRSLETLTEELKKKTEAVKIAFFDTHRFERDYFEKVNRDFGHDITFFDARLTEETAELAEGFRVVCPFVHDRLDEVTLLTLRGVGVELLALRSAGFNHVDLVAAKGLGMRVTRVPEYSPYAIAEHAMSLILALNRKIPRAYMRVREENFSLEGLVGFDLHGKTVGIIGTGRIGSVFARICHGFGCRVLAFDSAPSPELSSRDHVEYVPLPELYEKSDIVSLHVPLTPETRHMIDEDSVSRMKRGVMLINTSRGGLIETGSLIRGLKSGRIGYAGLDVYEEEENFFFRDLSGQILQDDQLARLLTFPNVLITSHQAFLTEEALQQIARTTLESISQFEMGRPLSFEVTPPAAPS